ncbi:hypothetical protein PAXRUDRAFT_826793 [Paxillus rubicundulus Ve08.2h10]|uniref:SPIN90/Ldb17 leucine-rich domain-containing protein n=1 Tax=Paxillus rubicundulus Ve08.2h10 TaxID=930991 RepID=A0A0D0DRI6_9AGAM|nr:hypothetical protein PAXRUDRAFT_826793 [Paxillus rubicundulus Ve08.2h10]
MMIQSSDSAVNLLAEDDFGIIYFIESPQQFWSELDDVLRLPSDDSATLSMLDTAFRRFVSLCASYHEQYLQSPLQLEHACQLLLDSELFAFHSERMCELAIDEVQSKTDPHGQFILYSTLLFWGRRQPAFLRNHKCWQPLIPLLMDHILVEIDPGAEDIYLGAGSSTSGGSRSSIVMVPIAIEAKLRSLGVRLLYEVCRVQKLSEVDLRIYSDSFLDHLFELVEQTRLLADETFNYSVIKLIVALNEQFMVAGLSNTARSQDSQGKASELRNRVIDVLISRLGSSKTFGENMIFMLNRASRSAEDLCMQLLVLKLLYILFTSKATSEYFYTNDLCVLVDVFLRELVDLDDESESLRHTYLRVLHPLLTKTQLRDTPYKRPQIVMALESLTQNANIRDVNPTTKRLVERCLSGQWCVQLRKVPFDKDALNSRGAFRKGSPSHDIVASTTQDVTPSPPLSANLERASGVALQVTTKLKQIKPSRSFENMKSPLSPRFPSPRSATDNFRRPSMDSANSYGGIASATASVSRRREKSGSVDNGSSPLQQAEKILLVKHHAHTPPSPGASSLPPTFSTGIEKSRRPPPAPPKRRKPPPVPVGKTHSGAIITAIASSSSLALNQPGK